MIVNPKTAPATAQWNAKTFHFCNPGCRERFVASPLQFVEEDGTRVPPKPKPAAPSGAIYVCPMHPEVRETKPGACPKCGMALEPENTVSIASDDNPELRDMTPQVLDRGNPDCAVLGLHAHGRHAPVD